MFLHGPGDVWRVGGKLRQYGCAYQWMAAHLLPVLQIKVFLELQIADTEMQFTDVM